MAKKPGDTYQILARKYRPSTFDELIGQEAMVRILRNAFADSRVSQAYMLTGVRGVGKTTTARIIAKGLNCTRDNADKAVEPCGKCESCISVGEGQHMDVLELDAASRSQVNEMRELLENVLYEPAVGRYKVYLIDEIHMLSNHAFNALLKTLEEPPDHVKFIFATTEIRKVPVTVLSRCQRFDLRRIEPLIMRDHLFSIAKKEKIPITEEAVSLITRAAEGSVRDAVSLLDQAAGQGGHEINVNAVREMLGLADRGRTLDLVELIMKGEAKESLEEVNSQYREGADPQAIFRDLAETIHLLSIVKVSPKTVQDVELPPDVSKRSLEMAEKLPMGVLARAWQMLLKAIEDSSNSPSPIMAVEMAVIRLCYVQEIPPAAELLKKLTVNSSSKNTAINPKISTDTKDNLAVKSDHDCASLAKTTKSSEPKEQGISSMKELVNILKESADNKLVVNFKKYVSDAKFGDKTIDLVISAGAPKNLADEIQTIVHQVQSPEWKVTSQMAKTQSGKKVDGHENDSEADRRMIAAEEHPYTQSVLKSFHGSVVSISSE